jgi:hypothetical protein
MIYKVFPTNRAAVEAVQSIADKVDGRLSIRPDEKLDVVAFLLAHRHQDSIHLPGYPKMTAALLDADIIGRAGGKADFFVKPQFTELQEITFATEQVDPFPFNPRNRSGLAYLSAASSKQLLWRDVAGLGHVGAYYISPVDFEATVAAFRDGYAPSVNFQSVEYPGDEDGALAFTEQVLEAARLRAIPLVAIADGFVCADAQQALIHFNIETIRHFNKAGLRFSFVTKDRYDRQVQSWGSYR